jgi:hypothetical protein
MLKDADLYGALVRYSKPTATKGGLHGAQAK